ncbi:hypothetical protein BDZ89DRAFT_1082147 [Hymenopellis radicata]|nr:hypothetical protein BDZ89DRAFT_1082147 [Hymenopellis radicata]
MNDFPSAKPMGTKQDTFLLAEVSDRYKSFAGDQQRLIDASTALLANPEQSLCPRHFLGCLAPIEHTVVEGNVWAKCHTLWLTKDASDDSDAQRCRESGCNLEDPFVAMLHEIGRGKRISMVCAAFRIIAAVLCSAAQEIKTARSARRVKKVIDTAGLVQPWPTSISNLLGDCAVDDFFNQLEVWIEGWPGYSYPYDILGSLALLFPQQFLTRIAQSTVVPAHTVVVLGLINSLSQENHRSGEYLLMETAAIMHFFDALLNDLTQPLLLEFIKDDEVAGRIILLCSQLLYEIPRMLSGETSQRFPGWLEKKANSSTKTLLRLGSTVHAHLETVNGEFENNSELDSRLLELSRAKQQRASSIITGAFDAFCSLAEWQRCAAPGCNGAVAAAALRKCSSCVRVMYCSPACQKEAWKHELSPHKELCKLATILTTHTGLPARPKAADLGTFYERVDSNEEMEDVAREFGECFRKLANSLGEGMAMGHS